MAPKAPVGAAVSEGPSHFHYHACAHAFSAQFTRPFAEQIDVQASSSLPPTGGHGCARVENFRFREFISFDKGYTHVSGGYQSDDQSNNTLVTSTLEGLNMLDVLTADRIVSRLYSKHAKGAAEGVITMHGSKFENLLICGHPVKMDLDFTLFEKIQTFEKARTAYADAGSDFHKRAKDPLRTGTALASQDKNGAFLCSLVKGDIQVDYPGVEASGHSIYVPGFGRVYFAEVFISHGQRTLTMLRFELGSTTKAGGSGGATTSNGKNYPPG
jgi:hypothetical protein